MTILHYVFVAAEVLLIFNLIIGVHELGHFLAARWRGMKVERFAIWFGKSSIWKKKIGDASNTSWAPFPQAATSPSRKWPPWKPSRARSR